MFVVAIVTLEGTVEGEAPLLASALGVTAYEAGLLLRGAPPVIVLRTDDRARATDLLGKLRARGHDAVGFDEAAVVDGDAMVHPRSFRLEGDALVSVGASEERLPAADLLAIVRAVHHTRADEVTTTKEKKTSLGRAVLSGGLVRSKTVTKETPRTREEREPVAYLFRRSGATPWLLAATRLRYDALGARIKPSQAENFETLLRLLAEMAPDAPLDSRLLVARAAETVRSEGRREQRASNASGIDVLAHVVAMTLARRR